VNENAVDEALVDSFFADSELNFEETRPAVENHALRGEQSKDERGAVWPNEEDREPVYKHTDSGEKLGGCNRQSTRQLRIL
jgi:hypothetical protein